MADDNDKVLKHRQFLRNREQASREEKSYPITRSAKEIAEGRDVKEVSQRRGIQDAPIKLNLRNRRKDR